MYGHVFILYILPFYERSPPFKMSPHQVSVKLAGLSLFSDTYFHTLYFVDVIVLWLCQATDSD